MKTSDPAAGSAQIERLFVLFNNPQAVFWSDGMKLNTRDTLLLIQRILVDGKRKSKIQALTVLSRLMGISSSMLCRCLDLPRTSEARYWKRFRNTGVDEFLRERKPGPKPDNLEVLQSAIFTLLHSPPAQHDINRTSWKLADLCLCLSRQGIQISKNRISKIIKAAGFGWKKAKVVLTSHDPEYQEKLDRVKSVLSGLAEAERFFSIDEFGPFAVKMKGGKKLAGPGENPIVPQFQKSKGCLIITAALELSQNQVTHFYSAAKNTDEMITLAERLVGKYEHCSKLYLSWDAASWHISKRLEDTIRLHNQLVEAGRQRLPIIELVPLPASAQFLNVIESVFSGMARAIIHNSDYESVDNAKKAIDRYFEERNQHFSKNPKRAGKKIWGNEIVAPEFAEDQNCKNPNW